MRERANEGEGKRGREGESGVLRKKHSEWETVTVVVFHGESESAQRLDSASAASPSQRDKKFPPAGPGFKFTTHIYTS